jgi:hypothetical protein
MSMESRVNPTVTIGVRIIGRKWQIQQSTMPYTMATDRGVINASLWELLVLSSISMVALIIMVWQDQSRIKQPLHKIILS